MTTDQTVHIEGVPYDHADAVALRTAMIAEVSDLYAELRDEVGDARANRIDPESVVVALLGRVDDHPVAHAFVRRLEEDLEIKRLFVVPDLRGRGTADALMSALLSEVRDRGAARVILHTGDRQIAAVRMYGRHGFTPIPVYDPYKDVPGSLCFEKVL
ncbi:MAG: GNAT family N-acetyltransferase [Nakamurella sp.]